MKIGIAGCGGIGSNVAVNLVRYGIKDFKIADFDIIDKSNLNRQFYFEDQIGKPKVFMLFENLKRISSDVNIEPLNITITRENISEVFKDCNIIVEGFDTGTSKIFLIEELIGQKELIVSASGVAGKEIRKIKTINTSDNLFIIGDFKSDIKRNKLYSTKIGIIAAMMANIIIDRIEDSKIV